MLPKQISPCPINEAVVELRFKSKLPSDAIFGVVFNELKDRYSKALKLPILQLPEAVRTDDPKLAFQPHYRLLKDSYALQVGPRVVSIAITDASYTTWESYRSEIEHVFNRVKKLGFISEVTRVGIRYINLFPGNIWKDLRVHLSVGDAEINEEEVYVRTALNREDFKVLLQIVNHLSAEGAGSETVVTAVDIDTFLERPHIDFFDKMDDILERGHDIEKEVFFEILEPKFLSELSPEY